MARGEVQMGNAGLVIPGSLFWPVVLLSSLAVRILVSFPKKIIEWDGTFYADFAQAFARGDWAEGLSTAWPPLYSLLIALASFAAPGTIEGGDPARFEIASRVVSVIAGTLLVIPSYLLARRYFSVGWAQVATILIATHPRLLHYSASALSEMTYTVCLLTALAAFATIFPLVNGQDSSVGSSRRLPSRPWLRLGAAGSLFALAYLARPEGFFLALAMLLVAVLVEKRHRKYQWAFLVGLLIFSLPYLLYLRSELGWWSLGEKGNYIFWIGYRGEYEQLYPPPRDQGRRVHESGALSRDLPSDQMHIAGFIAKKPGVFLQRFLSGLGEIAHTQLPVTVYHHFLLLGIVGLFFIRAGPWWLVVLPVVVASLLYSSMLLDRRYFVPLIPLLLLLSTRGMIAIAAASGRLRIRSAHRRLIGFSLLLAIVAFNLLYTFWRSLPSDADLEHRKTGQWLLQETAHRGVEIRDKNRDRHVVLSGRPWVAYYSGGLNGEFVRAPLPEFVEYTERRRAEFVVADERTAAENHKTMGLLLDPDNAPKSFKPIHQRERPNRIVLYQLE